MLFLLRHIRYDHLADVIHRVLDEKPDNVMDYFEEYSRRIREDRIHYEENEFKETYIEPPGLELAVKTIEKLQETFTDDVKEEADRALQMRVKEPDVFFLIPYYKTVGVSIPEEDGYNLSRSISRLLRDPQVATCRFWGKIFGLKKDYWILEAALPEEATEERQSESNLHVGESGSIDQGASQVSTAQSEAAEASSEANRTSGPVRPPIPPLPVSKYELPQAPPAETAGHGVNRFIYYVANHPSGVWEQLPPSTPELLVASRKIKKAFTGELDAKVISFCKFPGNEADLLRAQIARITSGGYVAPLNYWTTKKPKLGNGDENDEEEEEEEEEV